MKLKSFILGAACILAATNASAQFNIIGGPKYEFTTVKENPITPVKNQFRSGTCWCFSALSFIESEIIREKGDTLDLSEMFVVGKSYRDLTDTSISEQAALSETFFTLSMIMVSFRRMLCLV